jgi:hypothetical protein
MPRFVVALLCLALSLTSALAAPPERPAPGEVIDQVAKYTGLTNDTVSLALKDNAAALGRLTDAVQALQIAQQFLDAKNADIANTVLSTATDTAAEALLPPPLMTAIKAVRAYKSILEALRDMKFIPALEGWLYDAYRSERMQAKPDADPLVVLKSVDAAVKGYYPMKVAMIEELIKAKGWNVDVMGERMRRHAETQIDRFWANRLEATYQQEKVKPQKEAILAAIWASVKDILDQLKAPAAAIHAGLFPDLSKDMPASWWWAKIPKEGTPIDDGKMGCCRQWRQWFTISRASGFQLDRKSGLWCKPGNCSMPALEVGIWIMVDEDSEPVASAAYSVEYRIKENGYVRIGQHAAWQQDPLGNASEVEFAAGPYLVIVRMRDKYGEHATQEIGMHFARLVLARIEAEVKAKSASGR